MTTTPTALIWGWEVVAAAMAMATVVTEDTLATTWAGAGARAMRDTATEALICRPVVITDNPLVGPVDMLVMGAYSTNFCALCVKLCGALQQWRSDGSSGGRL